VNLSRRIFVAMTSAALLLGFSVCHVYAQDGAEATKAAETGQFRPWIGPQGSSFLGSGGEIRILEARRPMAAEAAPVVPAAVLATLNTTRTRRRLHFGRPKARTAPQEPVPTGSALLQILSNQQLANTTTMAR
jgi:hypothetical protein